MRHQAHADFCKRLGRDDRLGPRALIAAPDTANIEGRTGPVVLNGTKPLFRDQIGNTGFLEEGT